MNDPRNFSEAQLRRELAGRRNGELASLSPDSKIPPSDPELIPDELLDLTEVAPKPDPTTAAVPAEPKLTREELLAPAKVELRQRAEFASHPLTNAAGVIQEYAKTPFREQDLHELVLRLKSSIADVNTGDMKECEAMLMGQAVALQSIFTNMARRVLGQDYQKHMESFFAMALKAQNQCRMTLETLNELKNPRQATFVRTGQANIANGPQQVNNRRISRTRQKLKKRPNKLLEQTNGNRVDSPAAPAAKLDDPAMATLDAIDGTENGGGQGGRGAKRQQGRTDTRKAAGPTPGPEGSGGRTERLRSDIRAVIRRDRPPG
jgi:hypothetical protein